MNNTSKSRERRIALAFILTIAALGAGQALLQRHADAQAAAPGGYVLGPDDGEALKRGPTSIRVKADPTRGSSSMAVGTQLLPKGAGIPVHEHEGMDEVLYILEGNGIGILGDKPTPLQKGSSVFIPKGAWHGVQNPDGDLLVMWIVAPPGLEKMFRAGSPKDGAQPMTREQFIEMAKQHGTIFK